MRRPVSLIAIGPTGVVARVAIGTVMLAGVLALSAATAGAQLPQFANVQSSLQTTIQPLVQIVRFVLMAVCIVFAAIQFFSAARGQARGYLNGMVLLIVAGFCASPATWITLLGLTEVANNLTAWGF